MRTRCSVIQSHHLGCELWSAVPVADASGARPAVYAGLVRDGEVVG